MKLFLTDDEVLIAGIIYPAGEDSKMSEQNKSENQYEAVLEIIKGGYAEINRNYNIVYGYINGIKETEPGKSASLELMILERVPQDNSVLKEMERLKKIVIDNLKKGSGENYE